MQDRVSLYPGRVKLVPVSGQENTYDMVRADSPTQDGTPLNKDSLLKDATAALLGGDSSMLPDEALVILKTLVDNAQTSADGKVQAITGSYAGTGGYGSDKQNSLTFDSVPKILIIQSSGNYDPVYTGIAFPANGILITISTNATGTNGATSSYRGYCSVSGTTVSWYNAYNKYFQLNYASDTYQYFALL